MPVYLFPEVAIPCRHVHQQRTESEVRGHELPGPTRMCRTDGRGGRDYRLFEQQQAGRHGVIDVRADARADADFGRAGRAAAQRRRARSRRRPRRCPPRWKAIRQPIRRRRRPEGRPGHALPTQPPARREGPLRDHRPRRNRVERLRRARRPPTRTSCSATKCSARSWTSAAR